MCGVAPLYLPDQACDSHRELAKRGLATVCLASFASTRLRSVLSVEDRTRDTARIAIDRNITRSHVTVVPQVCQVDLPASHCATPLPSSRAPPFSTLAAVSLSREAHAQVHARPKDAPVPVAQAHCPFRRRHLHMHAAYSWRAVASSQNSIARDRYD
ncbi:MAG: hypothetical protein FE78DRAFT_396465 [Acidomyces sp. 'richmondensis']|nr:MAG: hypothetical protein FE78DRAFT_396465 [Acidomyces sp. 'richmondensis']